MAAWFANLSTYRIVESLREVIYAVKEVGGVYTVQVKPCNLRANIGMSYSPYDSWIYTYTTYQVTVGELDVKPILETPEDLSIFRGLPRGVTPGPCPIVLKGAIMAPREPRIKFTYEKVKIGDVIGENGITQKGSIPVATNDFGIGSIAETKHEVPDAELETLEGGVKVKVSMDLDHPAEEGMHWYNFEAVWNQKLPRSLTNKFSSKKEMVDDVETDVGGGISQTVLTIGRSEQKRSSRTSSGMIPTRLKTKMAKKYKFSP